MCRAVMSGKMINVIIFYRDMKLNVAIFGLSVCIIEKIWSGDVDRSFVGSDVQMNVMTFVYSQKKIIMRCRFDGDKESYSTTLTTMSAGYYLYYFANGVMCSAQRCSYYFGS